MQMTNKAARLYDPILTEVARGYQNLELIGFNLFPKVPVSQRGGQVITFGKEAFMQYANLQRSPGQNTKRITFGYAGAPFALQDYSLEGLLPYETQQEAEAVPGIDLAEATITGVQNIMALRLELAQAALATNAANYAAGNKVTLSGTTQWSDYSGTSNPFKDIAAAREAIRMQTGKYPNVMVVGAKVLAALQGHPLIVGRFTGTTSAIPSLAQLGALFQIDNVYVGSAVTASDTGVFSDAWGNNVVLAYTNRASIADRGTPSYGYTYQLSGYPWVEDPYADRNAKSWVYPVDDAVAPVIAGAESGFLIVNASA